jgi:hypothetical protein
MATKLYFEPEHGTIVIRRADDQIGIDEMIEITPEQAMALSLSFIGQCLKSIAESMPDQ